MIDVVGLGPGAFGGRTADAAHYEVYLLHSDLAQEVQHQLAAAAPASYLA